MTDRREQGRDTAPLDPAPRPAPRPWWSKPEDQWDSPAEVPAEQRYGAQPPYGAFGQPGGQAAGPAPEDPWRQPSTQAGFATGAPAWGYPTDTIGSTQPPRDKARRGGMGTMAAVLATALLAGGAGGYVGARAGGEPPLRDPAASLGTGSSATPTVNRAPDSVAGIAAKVLTSTVSIAVRGPGGNGTGSGVVIRSDGYVLTNNHVVESAEDGGQITVTFDGESREVPARIVGLDPVTDLAVLRVDTDEALPAATLGQSRALVVGDPVIAIGSPLGLAGTVTTGIVSALNRTVDVPGENGARNPLFNAIQTDAAINPGNSGGALVNSAGEVIGINSAIATLGGGGFGGDSGGSIGVGFAIPIDEARSVAEEIIRTGRATHPAIGISALTVGGGQGNERAGAMVRQLSPGGAASKAGLRVGDLIVAVGGKEVTSVDELILAVRENRVGDTVEVIYVRDGVQGKVQVTLQDLGRD
jgi:putative serine protease PepD